jgi:BlaI family transcriptional regulator, penicillinase repressor
MKRSGISEAEWEVMEVLWKRSPLSANQVVDALAARTDWAPTTVRTMLSRLTGKKIVATEKKGGLILFRPRVEREECVRQESESFLERVFGGATEPLLLHFAAKAKLSPDEVRELQRILKKKGNA